MSTNQVRIDRSNTIQTCYLNQSIKSPLMPTERKVKLRTIIEIAKYEEHLAQLISSCYKAPYFVIDSLTASELGFPMKPKHKTVSRTKDWECGIPDPDPFMKPVSNPSKQVRAKLRTKRKKQK